MKIGGLVLKRSEWNGEKAKKRRTIFIVEMHMAISVVKLLAIVWYL
jgi:hypothetical protein